MKKTFLAFTLAFTVFFTTGCLGILASPFTNTDSGTQDRVRSPEEYGKFYKKIQIPSYYPNSISEYTVNSYYYAVEEHSELCYEIFLDITVSESEFNTLLQSVKSDGREKKIGTAYHSTEYLEIIFNNDYTPSYSYYGTVENANIEKVIYNEAEGRIIFVLLYVGEDGIYGINEIEYFKKLKISYDKYTNGDNNKI